MDLLKNIRDFLIKYDPLRNQQDQSTAYFDDYIPSHKTIVFICREMPRPDQDSGSNRLKEIIISFKELQYNCILCTKNALTSDLYVNFFSELGAIVYVENNQYKNYFDFLKSIPKVDFVWYNGPNSLKKNLHQISAFLPEAKSIFDMVDIHFLRYQRAIALQPYRISLRKKHKKYLSIETIFSQNVDYVVTISDVENEIMSQYVDPKKLITISNIHYSKTKITDTIPFENRNDLLFIGSTHTPNVDAVYFLYNEIMPIVWEKLPKLKVNIIGNVNTKIIDINHANFVFHGYIQDIETHLTSNKIMIAPLRFGAGVKGKVGQAFEYFLPVVTTSIGAEGMQLVNEENALIYDSAADFANAILDLYTNKDLWQKLHLNSEKSLEPFSRGKLNDAISFF